MPATNAPQPRRWPTPRQWLLVLSASGLVAALIGLGAVALGLVPIAASSGHFAITEWFLQFAKRRAVGTRASRAELPALDAPWLVEKGAAHFHTGCRPCHGAPDLLRPPGVPRAMLPPPPRLSASPLDWQPEELFYIIKHGIKFTGMPAWPAPARDDEVLALMLFVRELPRLDAAAYRALAHGQAVPKDAEPLADADLDEPLRALVASCTRCHGPRGAGRSPAFPKLAGLPSQYLAATLDAYAQGARHSGIMQPIAAALAPEQLRDITRYYARTRDHGAEPAAQPEAVARGRAIARDGVPAQRVPSCVDCHGPAPEPLSEDRPPLAGQYADYLVQQLDLFARGGRGGTESAHLMADVAPLMNPAQIRDVAAYYASLAPGAREP